MNDKRFAFKIDDFDYTQGTIIIPERSCWYRAYEPSKEKLTEYPIFFGDMEVAFFYNKQENRKLGEFMCTRPLRVLDIRYLMSILPLIISKNNHQSIYEKMTLAFGLCSFKKQIELLKNLYNEVPDTFIEIGIERMESFLEIDNDHKPGWINPIEMKGVRIGISDVDFEVCLWLKDLLYPMFDGLIAPRMNSPFHDQINAEVTKSFMYEELILFNPKNALYFIQDRPKTDKVKYFLQTGNFQQVISQDSILWEFDMKPMRISKNFGGGGYIGTPKINYDIVDRIQTDKKLKSKYEKLRKSWLPSLKKIKAQNPIFSHLNYIPLKLVEPDETIPSGTPITRIKKFVQ